MAYHVVFGVAITQTNLLVNINKQRIHIGVVRLDTGARMVYETCIEAFTTFDIFKHSRWINLEIVQLLRPVIAYVSCRMHGIS